MRPDLAIYGRSVSPMSPGSYFISMVCTTSHGMHYASNRGQHLSKCYTSSHSIQGVVSSQWAVGATVWATSRSLQFWTFCVHNQLTLRQWHVYLAIQCVMCPQWALGATILQHHVHPVTLGPLVLQWVLGATIWTTSRSIHFQTFYVPNEP